MITQNSFGTKGINIQPPKKGPFLEATSPSMHMNTVHICDGSQQEIMRYTQDDANIIKVICILQIIWKGDNEMHMDDANMIEVIYIYCR
jgi:hypothetical protein